MPWTGLLVVGPLLHAALVGAVALRQAADQWIIHNQGHRRLSLSPSSSFTSQNSSPEAMPDVPPKPLLLPGLVPHLFPSTTKKPKTNRAHQIEKLTAMKAEAEAAEAAANAAEARVKALQEELAAIKQQLEDERRRRTIHAKKDVVVQVVPESTCECPPSLSPPRLSESGSRIFIYVARPLNNNLFAALFCVTSPTCELHNAAHRTSTHVAYELRLARMTRLHPRLVEQLEEGQNFLVHRRYRPRIIHTLLPDVHPRSLSDFYVDRPVLLLVWCASLACCLSGRIILNSLPYTYIRRHPGPYPALLYAAAPVALLPPAANALASTSNSRASNTDFVGHDSKMQLSPHSPIHL
ncbi:hypothetical protein C8R44DRAFT_739850 [Mycena epipterygia]|nr:hypothetical protein C8R44DRAFT_739850 [Mycena epipterygia]